MKKVSMLVLFSAFLLVLPNAFASDVKYTIQDIWTEIPHEGCCPTLSEAYAINDSGYVVGRLSQYPGQYGSPFLWKDGTFLTPGGIGGGFGGAIDINNSNQYVGYSFGPSPYHDPTGFFVDNGVTTTIPYFTPTSIDSNGNVYGRQQRAESPGYIIPDSMWSGGTFSAPILNPESSSPIPLPSGNLKPFLVPGFDPLWGDLTAADINSSGQIVGTASYGLEGEGLVLNHGFILTPVVTPEPASMALFGLGAGALALARRRKKLAT